MGVTLKQTKMRTLTRKREAWLVVGGCTMDDVPLALCDTQEQAVAEAHRHSVRTIENEGERLGWPESTPVCVAIVQFSGGVPVGERRVVLDLSVGGTGGAP